MPAAFKSTSWSSTTQASPKFSESTGFAYGALAIMGLIVLAIALWVVRFLQKK
jgi:hypothetical protein